MAPQMKTIVYVDGFNLYYVWPFSVTRDYDASCPSYARLA